MYNSNIYDSNHSLIRKALKTLSTKVLSFKTLSTKVLKMKKSKQKACF